MNRVIVTILQRGTSIPSKPLQDVTDPTPFQVAFQTEKFPVYPITICMYLENPPFNKFSICFQERFTSSRGTLYGSQDGHTYTKFHELSQLQGRGYYVKIFKEKLFFCYVRLILEEPAASQSNICRQIHLGGIQFSMVRFFNTRFVCSLSAKITYHPTLFRLLEVLQYKGLLLKENKNKLYEKYESRLAELVKVISDKRFNKIYPEESFLDKWRKQIGFIESEPIYKQGVVQYPDPVKVKRDIYRLQKELRNSEVNNFGQIKPNVLQYFQKYHNLTIKDRYLRYLSSNLTEDHKTALVDFWSDVKQLTEINPDLEEAVAMYFNFYLQFIDSTLTTSAIKTLILFSKRQTNTQQSLSKVYERVFENVLKYLHQTQDQELRQLSFKYCFILFDKIDNQTFLQILLRQFKRYPLEQQIQKLQILQKLTFRRVFVEDRSLIIDFLVELLLNNKLNLTQKNRAYNVAAYLASRFGKANVMKDFEKLNSMILMTMEKNIDTKIGKIGNEMNRVDQDLQGASCQYCGLQSKSFKDENLLDLHLAKQCKFITTCDYCQQNVEIPELFKHYIEQCHQKHNFKHCDNCFEVIHLKQEQKHNQKCSHKLQTRCPLCYQKIDNKLKLKEHILTEGCPNNPR